MKRSKKKNPPVSIVIVNWNGKKYLEKCLLSLQKVTYKPLGIIVVDQNSKDGSQEMVKKKFPKIFLIKNKENIGYVGGNNLGVKKAKGKYILILNNDIEVEKNFLEPLVEAMEKDKKLGCVQPKAINLRHQGKLDGAGSFFTVTGFLFHQGYLEDEKEPRFNIRYPVYSVKGAYMMSRRNLFLRLGGFDEDFFIYFEESDFCGRLWVAGYRVEYIPNSVVYHWGGGDTRLDWEKKFPFVQYRSFKNRICSHLKNLSLEKLLIVLPIHLALSESASLFYLLSGKWRVTIAIQKAIYWNLFNIRRILAKRSFIQNRLRKVSDKEIFDIVEKKVSPLYYWRLLLITK